ncbi:MAG: hypothetical protein ACPL68_02000 [Candidatus Hydrothermia bacterium]
MKIQGWFRDNALALLSQIAICGLVVWATISTVFWVSERASRQRLEAALYRGAGPASGRSLYTQAQYGSGSSSYDFHFTSDLKTGLEPVSSNLRDIEDALKEINGTLEEIKGAMK